jgi:hypothetical protein
MKIKLKLLILTTLLLSNKIFENSVAEEIQGDKEPTQASTSSAPTYGKVLGEKAQAFIKDKLPYGDDIVATTTCIAKNGFGTESLTEGLYNSYIGLPTTEVPVSEEQPEEVDGFMVIPEAAQGQEEVNQINNNASTLGKLWTGIKATAGCALTTKRGARIVGKGTKHIVENYIPYGGLVVKATGILAGKINPEAETLTEAGILWAFGVGTISTSTEAETEHPEITPTLLNK